MTFSTHESKVDSSVFSLIIHRVLKSLFVVTQCPGEKNILRLIKGVRGE